MLTEVLKSMIWRRRAEAAVKKAQDNGDLPSDPDGIAYFLRVPELVDVAHLRIDRKKDPTRKKDLTIVYPDPPLDEHERPLIEASSEGLGLDFKALSELEVTP